MIPLSAPNTTIPYSVSKNYNLLWPDQESIEVRVFQTLNPHTNSLAEAYFTGISAVIEDIPRLQREYRIPSASTSASTQTR